ncbi:MAG: hypothetical protein HY331_02810 [Chloroflexi bacterium]|nr:hypothetical protein [Chloroflexota bacterium]
MKRQNVKSARFHRSSPAAAYLAWTRAAGPFWQYVAATPFYGSLARRPAPGPLVAGRQVVEQAILPLVSPSLPLHERTGTLPGSAGVPPALYEPAASLPGSAGVPPAPSPEYTGGAPARAALLLDLPPELGLATTLAFQRADWLVVPLIHRWPARAALLSVDSILAQLVWLAPHLRRPADPIGVVFVLDADRARPKRLATPGRRFDNRYDYARHPFPPASALAAWGAGTVAIAGRERLIAADLVPVVGAWRAAGLVIRHIWVDEQPRAPEPGGCDAGTDHV